VADIRWTLGGLAPVVALRVRKVDELGCADILETGISVPDPRPSQWTWGLERWAGGDWQLGMGPVALWHKRTWTDGTGN
jgi:hypothetical protein